MTPPALAMGTKGDREARTTRLATACALASTALMSCSPGELRIEGAAMGTTWHATVAPGRAGTESAADLRGLLQRRLDELELAFTNWRESPVTRFNASRVMDWQPVPRELAETVLFARELSGKTDGAFDITVAPLVDLWGFGSKGRVLAPPSDEAIAAALRHVGWRKLEARLDPPALRKLDPEIEINVSSMANGYACDDLARLLRARGLTNFLLEIGGAVFASGSDAGGRPWRAGIQRPHAPNGETIDAISLRNRGLSTSGVYRQAYESGGRRFSHVLDARTGRPVAHRLVSVSVTAESAFAADGWDTALLILGPEAGRKKAEEQDIDSIFLVE